MKNKWDKRELVEMFMESPFYFELRLKERMELLKRLSRNVKPCMMVETKTGKMTKIIVGFMPPVLANPSP
jgi:hypothetical protein